MPTDDEKPPPTWKLGDESAPPLGDADPLLEARRIELSPSAPRPPPDTPVIGNPTAEMYDATRPQPEKFEPIEREVVLGNPKSEWRRLGIPVVPGINDDEGRRWRLVAAAVGVGLLVGVSGVALWIGLG